MASERDEELARTATAPGAQAPAEDVALADSFGRFKLERELGVGGMGVVHSAFDPDLERHVALKVLRRAAYDDEASARLRREAKAMARLAHPNVVVVHEVGQVDGRDFIAMELVDGCTLADWLRDKRRRPREIVAAFVAAGRGLAAAHAAGLVHRDFKPHNVLRRRDGRVVVTDFGLARGVDVVDPAAATVDLKAAAQHAATPSSLSGLTATGSVLGTPAYMSPEQWSGGVVGPAADQFGFCVALWEALTGERPFSGTTLDELKAEIARGAGALDVAKLPRRLRAPLRRGLDPDPKRRWPSMDALLDALERAERPWINPLRRLPFPLRVALAGAIVGGSLLYSALRGGASCADPARDPAVAWSPDASRAFTAAGRGELAQLIDRDVRAWTAGRAAACVEPHDARAPKLACLDGVLARIDVIRRAAERVQGELDQDGAAGMLIDPAACARTSTPRIIVAPSDDIVSALALLLRAQRRHDKPPVDEAVRTATRPDLDGCARSIALLAENEILDDVPASRLVVNDAVDAAEQCGDDRLRADALLAATPLLFEQPLVGPRGEDAIKRAQIAIDRVAQPDLIASVEMLRARVQREHGHPAEALELLAKAIDDFGARGRARQQVVAAIEANEVRGARAALGDFDAMRTTVARWRSIADQTRDPHLVRALAAQDAFARYFSGDITGGHAEAVRLWKERDRRDDKPDVATRHVDGSVVDVAGRPVAGATVVAARTVYADSIGIPLPYPFGSQRTLRATETDADGRFAFDDAERVGAVVAQHGALRSLPVAIGDHVRLVVEPTRRIEGRVRADAALFGGMIVIGSPPEAEHFQMMAPVRRDGTFEMDGAPTGPFKVFAAVSSGAGGGGHLEFTVVPASRSTTTGVELAMATSGHAVDVIARSTVGIAFDFAQVVILDGHVELSELSELMGLMRQGGLLVESAKPVTGEHAPAAVLDKLRPGDLVAHFSAVGGERTACAIGVNGDLADEKFAKKLTEHAKELKVKCVPFGPDDAVVVVEAPPQKRFD